ncbi:hypothetical protein [Salinivibrio sp. ES.052]|uniref:hypothetical protein n=1 Tax=Salinivibrio sp. ES.052 TaxID=1882823 RepID=UPI00092ADC60|nr:hypothetical protein [Salinivibrio sp. ES.052]SIO34542.1 hypothetical protein SAMN05444724_2853 [Salinivibrio sp. ES.052]
MTLLRSSCSSHTVLRGAGQFFIIALYLAAIAGIIHYSVAAHNVASEASLIELSQLILLAATVFTFRRVAKHSQPLHHAATLMSAFFLVLMIRELDATLDVIVHGFWKVPALLVTGLAIWPATKHWQEVITSLANAVNARSSTVLMIALGLLLVYSRLFGMSELWEQAMGNMYVRDVKSIAEESTELVAYALIWLSALGYYLESRQMSDIRESLHVSNPADSDLSL